MLSAGFRRTFFQVVRGLALVSCFCFAISVQAQLAKSGWPILGGNQYGSNSSTGANPVPGIKWSLSGNLYNPVIGVGGEVYLTDYETTSKIRAIDPKDGRTLWVFDPGIDLTFYLAVGVDGTVYATQYSGRSTNAPFGGIYALDGATGALLWSDTSTGFLPARLGHSRLLYTGRVEGSYDFTLLALNPSTGKTVWTDLNWSSASEESYIDAIGTDGTLFCVASPFSNDSARAMDGLTGNVKWVTRWDHLDGGLATSAFDKLCFFTHSFSSPTDNYYLNSADSNGNVLWTTFLTNGIYEPPAIADDGTIFVAYNGNTIRAFDPIVGQPLWTLTLPSAKTCLGPILDANGVLYTLESPRDDAPATLDAIDSATGTLLWSYKTPMNLRLTQYMHLVMAADGTIYFCSDTTLVVFQSASATSLSVNPTTLIGGTSATGVLSLSTGAPSQGGTYQITSSEPLAVPSFTVKVPAGQTSASFTIPTLPVASKRVITITAVQGGATTPLTVNPPVLLSVSLNPTTVSGGATSIGTVTLGSAAPASGLVVGLSSSPSVAIVPASVTIPGGATSATFPVKTVGVDAQISATITATSNGVTQTASLTVTPASVASVTFKPASVQGGTNSTATLTLDGNAGPSGVVVAVSSGNAAASVPSSVTIASGKSSTTFTVTTFGVNVQTSAVITGTLNGKPQSGTLTISPATITSVSLSPVKLLGGSSSMGTVTLSGPAGSGGTVVSLASSDPAASVPSSVTVPSGQTTATFSLTTTGVNTQTVATITATLNSKSVTATLTITPATLVSVSLKPNSVPGGTSSVGMITLSGPAGQSGTTITVSSSSEAAQVPSSVTVPSGQTTVTFNVTTTGVNAQTSAILTATLGSVSQTTTLSINAPTVSSVTLTPTSVQGGAPSTGQVTLSALAGPGGLVVSLSSTISSATVPTSVTVLYGQKTASFAVGTVPVSSLTYATIAANANSSSSQATLSITGATLASLSLNPTSVAGIATATGTVLLSGPTGPGGVTVGLSSSSANASVPSTVSVAAGQSSATFAVTTSAVTTQTTATISASFAGVSKTATLTLVPITLTSLSFNPNTVTGGLSSTGTVTLNGLAPKGGLVVKLTSAATNVKVPASVTILTGTMSVSFKATSTAVATQKSVIVTAKLGTVSQTATLTVIPPVLQSLSLAPTSVKGGVSSMGTVSLTGPASTGGLVVKLASSLTSVTVPATVTIPAGATSAKFTIKTKKVTAKSSSTITANLSGVTANANMTITP